MSDGGQRPLISALLRHNPKTAQCSMSVKNHDDETIAYCQSKGIVYEAYGTMRGCPFTDPDVLAIAKEHNVSASQVCLRWVLERGCISAAGTGSDPSTVVEYASRAQPIASPCSLPHARSFPSLPCVHVFQLVWLACRRSVHLWVGLGALSTFYFLGSFFSRTRISVVTSAASSKQTLP